MTTTLIIDGHPNPNSLCAALARSYAAGAADATLIALRELDFDPSLRYGYTKRMESEPDLVRAREEIKAAKHIVVVTPVWWGGVPSLLQGFFERALLPGEDFTYSKKGLQLPIGLLKGRSARMIVTCDTPKYLLPLMPTAKLTQISKGTLGFCGLKPVKVTRLCSVKTSTPQQRADWLTQMRELAAKETAELMG